MFINLLVNGVRSGLDPWLYDVMCLICFRNGSPSKTRSLCPDYLQKLTDVPKLIKLWVGLGDPFMTVIDVKCYSFTSLFLRLVEQGSLAVFQEGDGVIRSKRSDLTLEDLRVCRVCVGYDKTTLTDDRPLMRRVRRRHSTLHNLPNPTLFLLKFQVMMNFLTNEDLLKDTKE